MIKQIVFYLGLGALFTHELDAMTHHEWRMLPGLASLSDDAARTAFVALHVPLFAGLIALVAAPKERVRTLARLAIAGFLVVHGILHAALSGHPDYEFASSLSSALIFGGALLGAAHLGLEGWERRSARTD